MRKVHNRLARLKHEKALPWLSGPKRARTVTALRRLNHVSEKLYPRRESIRLFKRKLTIISWAAGFTY